MFAPTSKPEGIERTPLLHEAATQSLREAGHSNPEFWKEYLHFHALDEKLAFDVQRFLVNRSFEMVIGGFDPKERFSEKVAHDYSRDQMDARYCLLPQGDQKTWLRSFNQKVVPFIMKYNLGLPQPMVAA